MNAKSLMLNKQVLLALGMIVFIGAVVAAGTGAFFSSQASATGNVFTAGTLDLMITRNDDGGNPEKTKDAQWNFTNMAPGGTPVEESVWLRNVGSLDGDSMNFQADFSGQGSIAKQMRITTLEWDGVDLLAAASSGAGATSVAYVAPTSCDVTVSPGGLVAAVTGATPGQTICINGGSYNPGSLTVSAAGVTIVGVEDPQSAGSAKITGSFSITADNVTVRGLEIMNPLGSFGVLVDGADGAVITENNIHDIGSDGSVSGSAQAVYLDGGSGATGFTVSNNTISNVGHPALVQGAGSGSSAKGVYIGDSTGNGTITGAVVQNNHISDIKASTAPWVGTASINGRGAYGVLVNYGSNGGGANTGTTEITVSGNTITDLEGLWSHAVGLEGSTPGAVVSMNDINDIIDHKSPGDPDAVGVMVEDNPDFASIAINNNHFTPDVLIGVTNLMGGSVDAQNNWWGDADPSDQVEGTVDFSGFLSGPVSTTSLDANGNGYFDMHDFRANGIMDVTPGLVPYSGASDDKEFKMAVQLDSSTGNSFQGESLSNVTIDFTLNQN